MRFLLRLYSNDSVLPINYQYPLSAAIYKILDMADKEYAQFLHENGYGKGFKLFCFSGFQERLKAQGDRLLFFNNTVSFHISFHLPEASQNFIKGLFLLQKIDIADKKTKTTFTIQSVEALTPVFRNRRENEIITLDVQAASPIVAGVKNEKGNYDFLSPDDKRFTESLIHNWKEKIKSVYPAVHPEAIVLSIEIIPKTTPPKSRLITIKADTTAETKIRGYFNFGMRILGEKRFVELLYNSGLGLYNAMGMGSMKALVKDE